MTRPLRVSVATVSGDRQTYTFTTPFRIGRVAECEVFVNEDHVSRFHARVAFDGSQWVVEDLQSANGIYVGAQRVERLPVGPGTTFRLGVAGAFVTLEVVNNAIPPPVPKDVDRYFKATPGETVGDHTVMVRRAFQKVQKKQRGKYSAIVAGVTLAAIAIGAYAYQQHQQVAKQKALAEDIFYAMKALDVEIAANPSPNFQRKRQDLEKSYDRFLGTLHIYDPKMTEQDRLILRVARIFGECEISMPPGFSAEVQEYIKKWQGSSRMKNDIRLAKERGYVKTIPNAMLAQGLPPQFFYLAMQESNFDEYVSGPMTRMGIAKGMWQFIPRTAIKYGLKIGPLADLTRTDVGDDRHNYLKETTAATLYLKDLYETDAQASGLLVMACYNWGEDYVLPLVRKMPANPKDRNFWKLLELYKGKLPKETYDYVFYIFSASVIGENPRLFGFDFDNPLDR